MSPYLGPVDQSEAVLMTLVHGVVIDLGHASWEVGLRDTHLITRESCRVGQTLLRAVADADFSVL